ncbi:uncharacterized protein LOC111715538 [Eurytemora carolleeae]|uniref:uncharacterized protein LOC111715538 n=1 Tax=Eurytemora carolleeae TaxID=1294199 RepID=UPI000C75C618|nr:uncharacterized protein LOC111715538 [Eurytemora carolleeae]|eukprot:XP_023346650.1 uncharacterized protein LOC111715538 [Eurytemora affinis]
MDENLPDLTEEFKQFFIQELLWLMGKWLFLKDKNSNLREVSLLVIQAFTEISVPEQLIILGKNSVLCRVEEAGKVLCIIAERFGFEKFYTLLDLENVNGKLQALFPECVNIIKYDSFQVDEIKLQSAFRSMEKAETYDVSIHRDEVVGFLHNNPTESNFLSYDIFQGNLNKFLFKASCVIGNVHEK